jgi:photosystem II stability/assembly factor-like uncharacterized protein
MKNLFYFLLIASASFLLSSPCFAWDKIEIGSTEAVNHISQDQISGITAVCGTHGLLKTTNDGGKTWIDLSIPSGENFNHSLFSNQNLFICGDKGKLYEKKYNDINLTEIPTNTTENLIKIIECTEINEIHVFGNNNVELVSANMGQDWTKINYPLKEFLDGVYNSKDKKIYSFGKTESGGVPKVSAYKFNTKTWDNYTFTNDPFNLKKVEIDGYGNFYGVGSKDNKPAIYKLKLDDLGLGMAISMTSKFPEYKGFYNDIVISKEESSCYVLGKDIDKGLSFVGGLSINDKYDYKEYDKKEFNVDLSKFMIDKLDNSWVVGGKGTVYKKEPPLDTCINPPFKDTIEKVIIGLDDHDYIDFNGEKKCMYLISIEYNYQELFISKPYAVCRYKTSIYENERFSVYPRDKYGTFIVKVKYNNLFDSTRKDCGAQYVRVKVVPKPMVQFFQVSQPSDIKYISLYNTPRMMDKPGFHYMEGVGLAVASTNKVIYMWCNERAEYHKIWETPIGINIAYTTMKETDSGYELIILLNDGTLLSTPVFNKIDFAEPELLGYVPEGKENWDYFDRLVGDDLYITTNKFIYKSSDNGKNWEVDTNGLNNATVNEIALDKQQKVYLATSKGLMKQAQNETMWNLVSNFPKTSSTCIFIDNNNRIFASGGYSGDLYLSTDLGVSWVMDTIGIKGTMLKSFCGDRFGNVYAINSDGNKMFTCLKNQNEWLSYNTLQGLNSYNLQAKNIINSISADSLLYAATVYGIFKSSDFSKTWTAQNNGIPCKSLFGMIKSVKNENFYLSTNSGLFVGDPKKYNWQKIFPMDANLSGNPLYQDKNGALYTLGNFTEQGQQHFTIRTIYKSTDNGKTWNPDTTDLYKTGYLSYNEPSFFVDINGKQYIAYRTPSTSNNGNIWSKVPGGTWVKDEDGIEIKNEGYLQNFQTDGFENVYLSYYNNNKSILYKKSLNGGKWIPDSNGLNLAQSTLICGDTKNKKVYTGIFNFSTNNPSLFKRINDVWVSLNVPGQVPQSCICNAISIDPDGALFASFSIIDASYNLVTIGTYYTTDDGSSWTSTGMDKINVGQLLSVSYGTYAITDRGLALIDKNYMTSVNEYPSIKSGSLIQKVYPNPFSSSLNIEFFNNDVSQTTIQILDLQGRLILSYEGLNFNLGKNLFEISSQDLIPGVYIIKIINGKELGSALVIKN